MELQEKLNILINELNPIYVQEIDKTMFLASDVAKKWGHTNIKQSLSRVVNDSEKILVDRRSHPITYKSLLENGIISNKTQKFWLVTEPGVYMLAFTSNTKKSKEFLSNVAEKVVDVREKEGFSVSEFVDVLSGAYTFSFKKTYLLVDESTGYIKIGLSVNPPKREETLFAKKPTTKLIFVSEKNCEKELHKKYSTKRIRGEWFNLSPKEISDIVKEYNFAKVI
jgi:prophage antirepressor-like protein